jgi:hypothetical protein
MMSPLSGTSIQLHSEKLQQYAKILSFKFGYVAACAAFVAASPDHRD